MSVWLFGLTGLVFALQVLPVTGFFLMLMLAPYWSVVTVNLGFIVLAFEAATSRVPLVWLLVPIAYFGGYALFAHQSHRAVERLDAEARASNSGKRIAFVPASASLVIESNADDLGGAASSLVRAYRLPVAYTVTRAQEQRKPQELSRLDSNYRAERAGSPSVCRRIQQDSRFAAATAWAHFISPLRGTRSPSQPVLCTYSLPESPALQEIRISARSEPIGTWLLKGRRVRVELSASDGARLELLSGHAVPYAWLPLPIMGCFLNSARPKWECFAGFGTSANRGIGGTGAHGGATIEIVARALGLVPGSIEERRAELEATSTPELDNLLIRHETAAVANLDRLLADPTLRATVHDLAGLAERPDLLAPRADAMLRAMSAALTYGKGRSETARNLQRLLAHLPDAPFTRIGPALLLALDAGRPVQSDVGRRSVSEETDGTLLRRLGDLGPPALPTLDRLIFSSPGRPPVDAVLGLCRLGAPAAGMAERLAQHVRETEPRSDLRFVAFVTLLRLGRSDFAEALVEDSGGYRRTDIEAWRKAVSSDSGPQVCTSRPVR